MFASPGRRSGSPQSSAQLTRWPGRSAPKSSRRDRPTRTRVPACPFSPVGHGDVPVHRHRGLDATLGIDAGGHDCGGAGPRRHRPLGGRAPRWPRVRHGGRRLPGSVLVRRGRGHGRGRIAAGAGVADAIPFAVRMALHTGEADRTRPQLLRHRGEPSRAVDGPRPRRPGACCPTRPRSWCAAGSSCGPWATTSCAGCAARSRCSRWWPTGSRRSSRCCAASTTFPATCPARSARWSGATLRSTRSPSWCGRQRLVTLTGVGGVGKTRLAIEVGAELAGEFDDGVWIVELAGGR